MSQEKDKIFFRNFSLTLAFIAAMMIAFYLLADAAVKSKYGLAADDEGNVDNNVAELTKPVGEVAILSEASEDVIKQLSLIHI